MCIYIYIWVHAYVYIYIYMGICIFIYIYIYIWVCIYIYIHMGIIYICICRIYMGICVYIYIHTCRCQYVESLSWCKLPGPRILFQLGEPHKCVHRVTRLKGPRHENKAEMCQRLGMGTRNIDTSSNMLGPKHGKLSLQLSNLAL